MEELIDVLDSSGNKTGKTKSKSLIKRDGDFHKAVSICIINEDQEILMQKRSSNKKVYPNLWSIFVKGHVRAGETPLEACQREIFEELGIFIDMSELEYLYTIKEEKVIDGAYVENIFFDTYLLIRKISIEDIIMQEDEVSDVSFRDYRDVLKLVASGSNIMIPNINDYDRIFDLLKKRLREVSDGKYYCKRYFNSGNKDGI